MINTHICQQKTSVKKRAPCLCFILFFLLVLFGFINTTYASSVKDLESQKINEILFNIHTYYVDDLALQNSEYIEYNSSQFERLYSKLDAYSKYLDKNELNALFNNTNGRYTGLGIEVKSIEQRTTIVKVLNNSPAKQAGLRSGDIITTVNQHYVENSPIDLVAQYIKDSANGKVQLSITRNNTQTPLIFNLSRKQIKLTSVTKQLLDSGSGYIAINNFSNHTLHEVALQIAAMQNHYGHSLKGLIIDLRDNPGGTLKSAVAVADLFLQDGLIVTTKGRFYDSNQSFYAKRGDILKGAPIVVLINENSASAAEILAAALKENLRAKIVGSQSFGKGTVQSLIPLGDGDTALKLTTARYFTPLGESIEGIGVTPNVAINQTTLPQTNKAVIIKNEQSEQNTVFNAEELADIQLVKAKQLLSMQ
ncbi:S41 family peptidase [Pseudoalteromonas sp. S1609]|uniref:S41 family peptidase n=1 Tax=Pseudoalteromonas sp. S1609 TaxID=579505 RepID=UPI00110AF68A|nr:S41 family peptidase [Pseudoalteromonas sp. S1609]TMP67291.1 S41 family peptidase [Pseudoalteromonas sp. S1609]